jgi:hypothetical protein
MRRALLVAVCALASCRRRTPSEPPVEREDDRAERVEEEEDDQRDLYWRARIVIVGRGTVSTASGRFACTSDGTTQSGTCGPTLVRFKELDPPLLQAREVPGWRFDHWESTIRERDGSASTRTIRAPSSRMYMNGFGYADTGQLETVTAVFVAVLAPP